MEYRSKYKAEEIEAILDARNNTGEGVDSNLDEMFTGQLQTKEVEVSEDTTITADEGFLGLKEVSVKVKGGSEDNVVYFTTSSESGFVDRPALLQVCHMAKIYSNANKVTILQSVGGINGWPSDFIIKAVSINLSAFIGQGNTVMTIKEFMEVNTTMFEGLLSSATQITKEEFYNLES